MIKKKLTVMVTMLVAFLLQTTVFRHLALSDVVPNLMLVVTVSYAYLRGRTSGILVGLVCGLMLDMGYESVVGLCGLALMSIGFFVGFCKKFYFRNGLILPIILITVSDLLYGLYYYIVAFLIRAKTHFGFYFIHRILPEIIYTALVGVVYYYLIVIIEKRITTNRRREEEGF